MKTCRTLKGLLKAINKGENACLKYTALFRDSRNGVYEIYLANNEKLVVKDEVYNRIRWNLQQV